MKIKVLTIVVLLMMCSLSYSQSIDENMIKLRSLEKVTQLNDYISFMADKKHSQEARLKSMKKALNLFVGNGFEYEENGEKKEGVIIEFASKSGKVRKLFIRDYFNNLVHNVYTDMKITAAEDANINASELIRVSTNLWMCECEYCEVLEGMRDSRTVFRGKTIKKVICYISAEESEGGWEFTVKLGNVYALDTK